MTAADFSAQQPTILLISPPAADADLVIDRARVAGWRTIVVPELSQANAALKSLAGVSAIVLNANASGPATADAVAELRKFNPKTPLVVITDEASPKSPIQIIRAGATDYLRRPVEPERLLRALRAVTTGTLAQERQLEPFAEKFVAEARFETLVGEDPTFRGAVAKAGLIASHSGHVLIEGETGTGKNTLARAIHAASPRSKKQFEFITLRGMNERALQSCLFGHERNAFVGAFESRVGVLQQCSGGTLILDQIDRLPSALQAQLAESLGTRSVRPCGATQSVDIDVRIVCLSNRRLADLVADGGFSLELYRLLSESELFLPPLRHRCGDVGLIARQFVAKATADTDKEAYLTDEAVDLLCRFDWPRNIPQLQAVLLRAIAFARSNCLTAEDFPDIQRLVSTCEDTARPCAQVSSWLDTRWVFTEDGHVRSLQEVEAYVIQLAIAHYDGRISEVARRLHLGRSTLYRKLTSLGIGDESPERSPCARGVKNPNA